MAGLQATQAVNAAIADAKSLPSLIANLKVVDPGAATELEGKSLLASKSLWGTLASMVVSWAVTKWGLGWDAQTSAEVSGAIVLAATAGLRCITSAPIKRLF